MSRSTTFVGLTKKAKEYTNKLLSVPSKNVSYGMFDEEIPLMSWLDGDVLVEEVEQCVPWSSGPMIFTHLKVSTYEGGYGFIHSWVFDPSLDPYAIHGEYNETEGTFIFE